MHGGLYYAVCKLLLLIFPSETEVFSNYADSIFEFSSVNLTFSVLMILGFVVMIFELENKKKKGYN